MPSRIKKSTGGSGVNPRRRATGVNGTTAPIAAQVVGKPCPKAFETWAIRHCAARPAAANITACAAPIVSSASWTRKVAGWWACAPDRKKMGRVRPPQWARFRVKADKSFPCTGLLPTVCPSRLPPDVRPPAHSHGSTVLVVRRSGDRIDATPYEADDHRAARGGAPPGMRSRTSAIWIHVARPRITTPIPM
jgi:hypothetical protein